ncbi:MAG TPA: ABC transporter permease [Bryobacteraceae bacterium]|jgi:ABC-2 type transport system permease protein|nr:ABC transporter permease [Bryobacteraceae bacterium]
MRRALALVERDMRKFRRSPALLFASLVLPLVQLIILGNAFGGNIKNVALGVVNLDHGPESVDVLERVRAVGANARTFIPADYNDEGVALNDLRKGVLSAVLIIPQHYSRDLLEQHQPRLALITDNTDRSVAGAVGDQMSLLVNSINAPQVAPREPAQAALDVVEVYPYVDYIKYLLPGSVALAIFVTSMIGGGLLFIDDKSRGLHEGYMVTPITKWELILGFNLSGVIKAVLAGETVLVLGAMVAGVPDFFEPMRLVELTLMVILTSIALIGMMFFMMARINDPLVPRAIFGVLNTLLFFPSGAVYPIAGFPHWLRWMSEGDPFTYAVHGFRTLLLKNIGISAVTTDLFALVLTSIVVLGGATLLFRRTL